MKFNKSSILGVLIAGILVGWGISYTNCGQEISEHESTGGAGASDATNLTKGNTATPAYKGEKIPGVEFIRTDKGVSFVITDPKVKVEEVEGGFSFYNPLSKQTAYSTCTGDCSGAGCTEGKCVALGKTCGCPNDGEKTCTGDCVMQNKFASTTIDNENLRRANIPGVVFKKTKEGETFEIIDKRVTVKQIPSDKYEGLLEFTGPSGEKYHSYCGGRCNGKGCEYSRCYSFRSICGCSSNSEPGASCQGECFNVAL